VHFPCLHVVTDRDPVAAVEAAVRLGAAHRLAVQIRVEDDVTDRAAHELAAHAVALCRPAGVMCLVNDRLDVALAAGADGGHVGADDLDVASARRVLGPRAVLGATCRTPRDARAAVEAGATYLGVGPAYLTVTKAGLPAPLGPERVGEVVRAVPGIPVIAIGGVTVENAALLPGAGVAVIGAVADAPDPGEAVAALLKALP
jgi:thiamine-phosphate pyrophosphorylase